MLSDQKEEENKKAIQMMDRQKLRERLKTSHNNTVLLE